MSFHSGNKVEKRFFLDRLYALGSAEHECIRIHRANRCQIRRRVCSFVLLKELFNKLVHLLLRLCSFETGNAACYTTPSAPPKPPVRTSPQKTIESNGALVLYHTCG